MQSKTELTRPSLGARTHLLWAIAAVVALGFLWSFWSASAGIWAPDLSAIYMAGWQVATGDPDAVYTRMSHVLVGDQPAEWDRFLAQIGRSEQTGTLTPYIYPPLWAWILAPVTQSVSIDVFFAGARFVLISAHLATIVVVWRLVRLGGVSLPSFVVTLVVLSAISVPVIFSLQLAQPQLLLNLLLLFAVERYLKGQSAMAGCLLGIVVAVKLTPVFFALIFVGRRDWRAVTAVGGTATALALLSVAVAGIDPHIQFMQQLSAMSGVLPLFGGNTSIWTTFALLFGESLRTDAPIYAVPPIASLAFYGTLILALWALFHTTRRMSGDDQTVARVLGAHLAMTVFFPTSWCTYQVTTLLLLPFLVKVLHPALFAALGGVVMSTQVSSMGWTTWLFGLDHGYATVVAPALLVVFLSMLAGFRWINRAEPTASPPPDRGAVLRAA